MKEFPRDSFDLTHRTIFGLLGQHLFSRAYEPEPDVDWKAVLHERRQQAVTCQVFADCSRISGMDAEVQAALRSLLVRCMGSLLIKFKLSISVLLLTIINTIVATSNNTSAHKHKQHYAYGKAKCFHHLYKFSVKLSIL